MVKVVFYINLSITLILSALSCKSNEKVTNNTHDDLPTWIIGTWKQIDIDDDEQYTEIWKMKGDTLIGGGYFTNQDFIDTLNPQVKIYNLKGGMVHEFIGSKDLTFFTVMKVDDNCFICVNPDQKAFPSSLKYTLLNSDNMIVEIIGNIDGINDSYAFNMMKK